MSVKNHKKNRAAILGLKRGFYIISEIDVIQRDSLVQIRQYRLC